MLRFVRRALAVAAFAFVVAPAAQADPGLTATATPAVGAAPLNVTLTASGDDAAFHWVLGDGTSPTARPSITFTRWARSRPR